MIDLKKLQDLLQKTGSEKTYPKHIVINLFPLDDLNNFGKIMTLIPQIMSIQNQKKIPIITISLGKKENIDQNILFKNIKAILSKASELKTNVTIFGRWYDLKGELVEELKRLNNETDNYDHHFFNICINYDPKQEIADASKVMIKKILAEKLDHEKINIDTLKENVYSSFFIPVELTIEPRDRFNATFLWDSQNCQIQFLNKSVDDIIIADFDKTIEKFKH